MTRFDRYLLRRFLVLFGFFSLVLISVYWVNRAVVLCDQLIANGHSAGVFVEFTALTLPNVIRLVLPVSAFAATVYATSRLRADSELTALQSSGLSPWRMARPALWLGAVAAMAVSALAHVVVPASQGTLSLRTAALSEDMTAGLLTDGTFLHPTDGTTFYVREITPEGELRDMFLDDARDPARRSAYTARRAVLVKTGAGPRLAMFDGMVQTLRANPADAGAPRLSVTRFEDFVYDMRAILRMPSAPVRRPAEVGTLDLLRATPALRDETGRTGAALRFEGHQRIVQGTTALMLPVMALGAMLLGRQSRMGSWRQVAAAVAAMIAVEMIRNAVAGPVRSGAAPMALAYAPTLLTVGLSAAFLMVAGGTDRWAGRAAVPA